MEIEDEGLFSGAFSSQDIRSIDSNPRSDFDFEELNTDVADEESDAQSIVSKTHLRKL
jgi:hypothetical protein